MLALGRPLDFLWSFELPGTPRSLWPLVSDTTRWNRAMGSSRMTFVEGDDGVVRGTSRPAGVPHEWLEVPWTWVAGRTLSNVRDYQRGFPRLVRAIYRLEAIDAERTRFDVYFGWIPRGALSRAILKLAGPDLGKRFGKVVEELRQRPKL